MNLSSLPVKGTRDYLPNSTKIRDNIMNIILETYQSCGFQRINTPIIEDISRLKKSDGGENLNLIFEILKRGSKLNLEAENLRKDDLVDLGLRYDLTLPLSRFFSNNQNNLRYPFKCIQIDKVFRAERPQKGRLREFYQCDIDIIGDNSVNAEIELIYTTAKTLINLGFKDFIIKINDRRLLNKLILNSGFVEENIPSVSVCLDKLDKIGIEGVKSELLSKSLPNVAVENFLNNIFGDKQQKNIDFIDNDCDEIMSLKYIINTINKLSNNNYKIQYDKSLVRGMGYYTGTIFEIVSPEFSASIAGGGRYDNMIGKFLKNSVPAVGFSIGFERVFEIISQNNFKIADDNSESVALLYDKSDNLSDVILQAENFRQQNYIVILVQKTKKIGKQLDKLEKDGVKYFYIFNDSKNLQLLKK